MRKFKTFDWLPSSLRVVFFVFLAIPFISFYLITGPREVYFSEGLGASLLVLFIYWIGPALLCYAILEKHLWFLPIFFTLCFTLVLHSLVNRQQHGDMLMERFGLIAVMAFISMLLTDRNFIYPFITRTLRFWRRANRVKVNLPMFLLGDTADVRIEAQMQNCSLTGLGIEVPKQALGQFLDGKYRGAIFEIEVHLSSGRYVIPTEFVWTEAEGELQRVGLRYLDPAAMAPFVAVITGTSPSVHPLHAYWAREGLLHLALVIWVVSITGAFFMTTSIL